MSYISLYGNQLFLSSIFTQDTTNFPLPTSFSVALLTAVPDRNDTNSALAEVATTVAGSTNVQSGNYYPGTLAGLTGGTYLNYFLSSPMSYAFADGQSVTITNTATGYNTTGIVKNTVLSNSNTILPWISGGAYAADDVVTYNGAYYVNLTGTNCTTPTNTPLTDNTRWKFLPYCNYSQFTIFVSASVSTTFSGATGTVVGNTGYARQSIGTGSAWTAGQSSVYNTNVITWPAAYLSWGNVIAWAQLDNSSNVIACGELQQGLLVRPNSIVTLPAKSLRLFIS